MKILIGYDGSESADAAITTAGKLLAGADVEAIVLSVWEPVSVAAVHASRFGAPMSAIASDASDVDDRSEQQARKLAEHGAELARHAGFDAKAVWVADDRDVPRAIVGEASEVHADLFVLGARGLAGIRAFLGSVSNHVLQHSRRPVLVIPASSASKRGANPEPPASLVTSAENGRGRPRASKISIGARVCNGESSSGRRQLRPSHVLGGFAADRSPAPDHVGARAHESAAGNDEATVLSPPWHQNSDANDC